MEQNTAGMDNHKSQFLVTISQNMRQLTDFMRNELSLPSSTSEDILGRQVAKTISFMSFNIDPMQIDVNPDAVVNEFLLSTNNLTNITKYKNFRFYPLLSENLEAVAACFGIYFITRMEQVKGFAFVLPLWLTKIVASKKIAAAYKAAPEVVQYLNQLKTFFDTTFGPGDNGRFIPGGIYFFYKYFKGQPYFGMPEPIRESCSIGYFKGTWQKVIEDGSGMSFETATEYFLKYYPYIKSGYYNMDQWEAQSRKDIADIAAGRRPKNPAPMGGSPAPKSFLQRLFGL
jgi:hypothetical protein